MTRFWITLDQGVEFVNKCFRNMHGGEVFVPKIPSARIGDIAEALAPGMAHRIVGIRPGEKLHEIMWPRDDSRLALEFADHFLIQPSIKIGFAPDYSINQIGDRSRPVTEEFEYTSGTNTNFLTIDQIRGLL